MRFLLSFWLVLLLAVPPLGAEPSATASPEPTPVVNSSVPPVAASEVVPRLEASLLFLRELEAGGDREVEKLGTDVDNLEREALDASRLLPSQIAANLTPSELEQLERRWQEYQERLAGVRQNLQGQSESVEKTRAQSLEQGEAWREALDRREGLAVPQEILEQVEATEKRLRAAERELGERQAALFSLLSGW